MIVPPNIEQSYDRLRPLLAAVQSKAEPLLRGIANAAGGRYGDMRLKPAESLYMKLEKEGQSASLLGLDDLVAGTIVVPNKSVVPKVEGLLAAAFDQATPIPAKTGRPETFIYDDRHMIVRLKQDPLNPDLQETQINIEVQIKTEMQAASSVITRGLSYKPTVLSWAKSRLAGQLRALVEVADSLLASIELDPAPDDGNAYFSEKNELLRELEQSFPANELPEDRRRFVDVVESIRKECRHNLQTAELGMLLRNPRHTVIQSAQSLSVVQKIFLMLLADGRLGNMQETPPRLLGKRCYVVTELMEALCPAARLVPQERRLQVSANFDIPMLEDTAANGQPAAD